MKAKPLRFYGTLGPACREESILRGMFAAGMTGVRLNLSHTDLDGCAPLLKVLQKAADGRPYELLIDLRGPELRVGELPAPLPLAVGECVRLGEGGIPLPVYAASALCPGQELLLDDGAMLLRIEKNSPDGVWAVVLRGGTLLSRKSAALPGGGLRLPTLTESDRKNLALAAQTGVTGVMLPFVRDADDLKTLRAALAGADAGQVRIFAKLENQEGVRRLPELLPEADEIVIARGDLGNDMPLWELPAVQKRVSALCRAADRLFMIVTQLLHSMQQNAVPTRAEVLDIFNAVLDGASSLMLTGETAVGAYPVEAMRYLVETAEQAQHFLEG